MAARQKAARADMIARDLYDMFQKRSLSATDVKKFLNCSMARAGNIVAPLEPIYGENTGRRYYYRDIAEALAAYRQ